MMIARALDPTAQPANAAARATTDLADEFDVTAGADNCWIDYVVKPRRR